MHAPLVSRPSTSGPSTTVDPLPDLDEIIPESIASKAVQTFGVIFFQIHFTTSATLVKVVLSQSG